MMAPISGGGDERVAIIPATSSTSAAIATVLLPSCAAWSTTLLPPSAAMASARSDLNPSHVATSETLWVMTILGIPTPLGMTSHSHSFFEEHRSVTAQDGLS